MLGDPVRHSMSPAIFDAAFDEVGLDWCYVAFEVAPADLRAAVAGAAALGVRGLNITTPHKAAMVGVVDQLTPRAAALAAVNCVSFRDGEVLGDNTDGQGFVDALAWDGVDLAGRRVVVLGAGGAARAIVAACADAGAGEVVVVNRSAERAVVAAGLAGAAGRVGDAGDVSAAQVVVNATSVGFGDPDGIAIDPDSLSAGQVVVDVVYHPLRTRLLAEAERRGARPVDGLGMLVGQAAVAFERWTGEPAPVQVMRRAAAGLLPA